MRRLGNLLLFVLVFLLILFANHRLGAGLMGNMANRDFMHLVTGTKALTLGLDPYNPQIWPDLRISAGSSIVQDPTCIYPLWTLILFAPLSLLPFSFAVSFWMTASELALVVSIFLLLLAAECQRVRWLSFSALVGGLVFRPFIVSLTSGQTTPFILLTVAGALALYARGQSFWCGFLLGLSIIKPHLLVLFLPAVGLLFLTRRDWRALGGVVASVLLLSGISWVVSPGWLFRWLRVSAKSNLTFSTPTLWGMAFDLMGPERWILVGTAAVVLVSGGVLFMIVRRCEDWLFGMGLAMCGSLLVTLYLWNYDQLLLLVPALVAFCRFRGPRFLRILVWFLVLFVIPWALFWIANVRGLDSFSAFVTLAVMGYLCVSWWGERGFSAVLPRRAVEA